jgi:type I restriction enzyme S subunit
VAISESEFNKNKALYGDIFFTRSSLVKEGIAFSNVFLEHSQETTFDGHLIRMRPNQSQAIPIFLFYLLKSDKLRRQLVARGKTGTMTTIGQNDISTVLLFIPSLPEQQKIANFLSAIDQKINLIATELKKAETFKKGLLQQMFI